MAAILSQAIKTLQTANRYNSSIKEAIRIRGNFFCIPFIAHSGVVDRTETGYTGIGSKPQDFTSFTRMIAGTEAFTVEWEGSTVRYFNEGIVGDDNKAEVMNQRFQVGKFRKGDVVLDESGSTIQETPIEGFKGQTIIRSVSMRFLEPFTDQDKLKLYLIPSFLPEKPDPINRPAQMKVVKNSQWLIVSNYRNIYTPDNKRFLYSEVQFSSLGDLFASSGQSIWQMVQLNSGIGGGAAFPLVRSHEGSDGIINTDYEVVLNTDVLKGIGVKYLQVEAKGLMGLSSFYAMGRPNDNNIIDNGDGTFSNRVYVPRHLVSSTMEAPLQDPVSNFTLPQNKYVLYMGASPTILSGYQEWKDNVQAEYDFFTKKNAEGWIITDKSIAKYNDILNTNPTKNSSYPDLQELIYWDNEWIFGYKGIKDIKGNYGLVNGYSQYPKGNEGFVGQADQFQLEKMEDKSMANVLAASAFIFNQYQLLPVESTEFTTVKIPLPTGILNYIPIIGGYLNSFFNGVSVGFNIVKNSNQWPRYTGIHFFMSKEFLTYSVESLFKVKSRSLSNVSQYASNAPYDTRAITNLTTELAPIAFEMFRQNDNSSAVGAISGSNMTATTFMIKLTDKVSLKQFNFDRSKNDFKQETKSKVVSTLDIGQFKGEFKMLENEGNVAYKGKVRLFEQSFSVRDSETPYSELDNDLTISPTPDGTKISYCLDMINLQSLFVGDYTITAFWDNPAKIGRENAMIYQANIKSSSSYHNNNTRDWFTKYKTSAIEADGGQLPNNTYPKAIQQPVPFDIHTIVAEQTKDGRRGLFGTGDFSMKEVGRNWNPLTGLWKEVSQDTNGKLVVKSTKDFDPSDKLKIKWKTDTITDWDTFSRNYGSIYINWDGIVDTELGFTQQWFEVDRNGNENNFFESNKLDILNFKNNIGFGIDTTDIKVGKKYNYESPNTFGYMDLKNTFNNRPGSTTFKVEKNNNSPFNVRFVFEVVGDYLEISQEFYGDFELKLTIQPYGTKDRGQIPCGMDYTYGAYKVQIIPRTS